jgi:hypothetical protein
MLVSKATSQYQPHTSRSRNSLGSPVSASTGCCSLRDAPCLLTTCTTVPTPSPTTRKLGCIAVVRLQLERSPYSASTEQSTPRPSGSSIAHRPSPILPHSSQQARIMDELSNEDALAIAQLESQPQRPSRGVKPTGFYKPVNPLRAPRVTSRSNMVPKDLHTLRQPIINPPTSLRVIRYLCSHQSH